VDKTYTKVEFYYKVKYKGYLCLLLTFFNSLILPRVRVRVTGKSRELKMSAKDKALKLIHVFLVTA